MANIKGRDVLQLVKEKGDRGLVEAVVQIAERQHHLIQEMKECSKTLTQFALTLDTLATGTLGMKKVVEQMQARYHPDSEGNPEHRG